MDRFRLLLAELSTDSLACHHPPTGPARSGRPDDKLQRMIQ
jgi:hypothetical protein